MTVILEWLKRIIQIGILDFLRTLGLKAILTVIATLVAVGAVIGIVVVLLLMLVF